MNLIGSVKKIWCQSSSRRPIQFYDSDLSIILKVKLTNIFRLRNERKAVDTCAEELKPNPADRTILTSEAEENQVTSLMRDTKVEIKLKTGKRAKIMLDRYLQI